MFEEQKNRIIDDGLKWYTEYLESQDQVRALGYLNTLRKKLGPVVSNYPVWHPLIRHIAVSPSRDPLLMLSYPGVDHALCFANGFITAPYNEEMLHRTIDAIESLPMMDDATLLYERLHLPLYHYNAIPMLVRVEWKRPLLSDGTLPPSIVIPNVLKMMLAQAFNCSRADDWRNLASHFLGSPRNDMESAFVNENTAGILKRIWDELCDAGCFGPHRVYIPGEQPLFAPDAEDWPWKTVFLENHYTIK